MGESLDMSEDGNHLIIGAHGGTNLNAFVYDYNSGTNAWDNIGGSTLVGTSGSNFGVSSAISNDGNVIAVGANSDAADGTGWGRVYMYKRSGTTWVLVSTLRNPSGANAEYFGTSVSLSGDGTRLIAGAIYYDPPLGGTGDAGHAGRVYTFEYIETSWVLRGQHPVSSATNNFSATGLEAAAADTTGAHLGQSHSIAISRDGSTIIGGGYLADAATGNRGRVRVFSMPSNIKSIWGSNDDTNWTKITTGNKTFRFTDRLEFKNLDNPNYYKYHAIVADAFTRLKDVKLYGIRNQGSSTLNDGALTLTKNLDVPRIGPPLGADDTPRRDKLFVEYNTFTNPTEGDSVKDTSGRGFDSVFKGGASYDVTQKALKFDGSGDYTEVQLPAHYVKDAWIHSVSCWVKGDVINGEEAVWNIGDRTGLASAVVGSASTLSFNSLDPTLRWYFYNADAHNSNFTIQESQWYHIVCVYSGGVSSATSQTIYVNGVKYAFDTFHGTGGALNFDESRERVLMLGRLPWSTGSDFDGGISQFKLYDCALTTEEVKTLYDMGRTGSVANPQPLHIAAPLYSPGTTVQLVHRHVYDYHTVNSNNGLITPMNTSITPKFSSSKILVQMMVNGEGQQDATFRILRYIDGSSTGVHMPPDTVQTPAHTDGIAPVTYDADNNSTMGSVHIMFVDTPNTTGIVEYKLYYKRRDSSSVDRFSLNQVHADATASYTGGEHSSSSVVLQEIAH
jgi:hypothetical protein